MSCTHHKPRSEGLDAGLGAHHALAHSNISDSDLGRWGERAQSSQAFQSLPRPRTTNGLHSRVSASKRPCVSSAADTSSTTADIAAAGTVMAQLLCAHCEELCFSWKLYVTTAHYAISWVASDHQFTL